MHKLRPWCHPYCLPISHTRDATHWRRPAYCVVARVERPLFAGYCRCVGTTHLFLLAPVKVPFCILAASFLRSAAHEGVLRRRILSELPLCFGSLSVTHPILCSF